MFHLIIPETSIVGEFRQKHVPKVHNNITLIFQIFSNGLDMD